MANVLNVVDCIEESDSNSVSNLTVLSHFFKDSNKCETEWTMKCKFCSVKIKSRPTVTSKRTGTKYCGVTTVVHGTNQIEYCSSLSVTN